MFTNRETIILLWLFQEGGLRIEVLGEKKYFSRDQLLNLYYNLDIYYVNYL